MTASIETLSGAACAALWSGTVDTSAFALLVYAASAAMRPSAETRHKLWLLVIVLAVAVPLASFTASLSRLQTVDVPVRASLPASAAIPTIVTVKVHTIFPPAVKRRLAAADALRTRSDAETPPRIEFTITASALAATLLALWLSIALAKHAGLYAELLALSGVKRRAVALTDEDTRKLVAWRTHCTKRRTVTLARSRDVSVPCAAGLGPPAILLPESVVVSAASSDLDRIVMHEYAHLYRFDDWTNLGERIVSATLWFHPAVALARRRIAIDREMACDDWVVARTGSAHGYASCLFRLAEATLHARTPGHAIGALGNPRNLTTRIERLLRSSESPRRAARTLPAALAICAFATVYAQAAIAPAIAVEVPAQRSEPMQMAPTAPIVQTGTPIPLAVPHEAKHAPLVRRAKPAPILFARNDEAIAKSVRQRRLILTIASEPVAPVPAAPAEPALRALSPHANHSARASDSEMDAAAEHLSAAAARMAEHALERAERAERSETQADRVRRDADAADERAAEREVRDAAREIGERARAAAEIERRDDVRAAVDELRRNRGLQKQALERELRGLREQLKALDEEPQP